MGRRVPSGELAGHQDYKRVALICVGLSFVIACGGWRPGEQGMSSKLYE